jgi:hypothetical protein
MGTILEASRLTPRQKSFITAVVDRWMEERKVQSDIKELEEDIGGADDAEEEEWLLAMQLVEGLDRQLKEQREKLRKLSEKKKKRGGGDSGSSTRATTFTGSDLGALRAAKVKPPELDKTADLVSTLEFDIKMQGWIKLMGVKDRQVEAALVDQCTSGSANDVWRQVVGNLQVQVKTADSGS